MTSIIYKNDDFVVINKPFGVPSQADKSGDADAITLCKEELRREGDESELHIINRLDRVVGGLVLLAKGRRAAADLSALLGEEITKEYRAVVLGECGEGEMRDFLYKDATLGKSFVMKDSRRGAKEAILNYSTLETINYNGRKLSLVKVTLKTGRFHQIRAQFSSRNMPLVGDKKYGSKVSGTPHPALFASRLAFSYKGKEYDIKANPDITVFPWSLFDKKNFEVES